MNLKTSIFFISLLFTALVQSTIFSQEATSLSKLGDKSAITASDYCQFLNSVAITDPDHFYDEKMNLSCSPLIIRTGEPGSYYYEVMEGKEEVPMTFISKLTVIHYLTWRQDPSLTFIANASYMTFDKQLQSTDLNFYLESVSCTQQSSGVGEVASMDGFLEEGGEMLGMLAALFAAEVPAHREVRSEAHARLTNFSEELQREVATSHFQKGTSTMHVTNHESLPLPVREAGTSLIQEENDLTEKKLDGHVVTKVPSNNLKSPRGSVFFSSNTSTFLYSIEGKKDFAASDYTVVDRKGDQAKDASQESSLTPQNQEKTSFYEDPKDSYPVDNHFLDASTPAALKGPDISERIKSNELELIHNEALNLAEILPVLRELKQAAQKGEEVALSSTVDEHFKEAEKIVEIVKSFCTRAKEARAYERKEEEEACTLSAKYCLRAAHAYKQGEISKAKDLQKASVVVLKAIKRGWCDNLKKARDEGNNELEKKYNEQLNYIFQAAEAYAGGDTDKAKNLKLAAVETGKAASLLLPEIKDASEGNSLPIQDQEKVSVELAAIKIDKEVSEIDKVAFWEDAHNLAKLLDSKRQAVKQIGEVSLSPTVDEHFKEAEKMAKIVQNFCTRAKEARDAGCKEVEEAYILSAKYCLLSAYAYLRGEASKAENLEEAYKVVSTTIAPLYDKINKAKVIDFAVDGKAMSEKLVQAYHKQLNCVLQVAEAYAKGDTARAEHVQFVIKKHLSVSLWENAITATDEKQRDFYIDRAERLDTNLWRWLD